MRDPSAETPLLMGYRSYPARQALEKGLISTEDHAALGRPEEIYLLFALGSWRFGDKVGSQATYITDAQHGRGPVERFETGGGGRHPGLTCGSGYWDTLHELTLPEGAPCLLVPGWLDGWHPSWEGPRL